MRRKGARCPGSRLIAVAGLVALCACSTGGPMQPLPHPVDAQWLHEAEPQTVPQSSDWWRALGDPTLDALIAHAVTASPTLQSAAAKVAQARAQMRVSGAGLWPQIDAGGGLNLYRLPPEVAQKIQNINPTIAYDKVQLQGSWELDFWGKAKNAARADAFTYLSTQQEYRASLVSLIGQLASAYVSYRTDQARLALARATAAARDHGVILATARHRDGSTDEGDPAQAVTTAAQQSADVATLAAQTAEGRHAIALLAGMTDGEAAPMLDRAAAIPATPPPPDPGLPRDLLRVRPDVMEAELAARAQYARLKSTKANLYPSFSLAGSIGLSATNVGNSSLTDIFNWNKRAISGGLSFALPLFDHGKLMGQIEVQDAGFEQALQGYEEAVLSAQRDVADALAQDLGARKTLAALTVAAAASQRQIDLAQARYRDGSGTRQDILNAETNDAAVRDALIQAQGNAANAYVALNRALGLGADAPGLPPPLSAETSRRMKARTHWGKRLDPLTEKPHGDKP